MSKSLYDAKTSAVLPLYSIDPSTLHQTISILYGNASFGHNPSTGEHPPEIATAFGEILPDGLSVIWDGKHMNLSSTTFFADFGMGNGKAAMQAFLSYTNLKKVVGVELVTARYECGVAALRQLHKLLPDSILTEKKKPPAVILTTGDKRTLEFRKDNLLNATDCFDAGVVFMEIVVPVTAFEKTRDFLNKLKVGSRLLTYQPVTYFEGRSPFTAVNPGESYAASWGRIQFYLYTKS